MRIVDTTPDQDAAILAVLGVVATAGGEAPPSDADQAVIGTAARDVLGATDGALTLPTDLPDGVAVTLSDEDLSELAMSIGAILCLADSPKSADGERSLLDPARVDALRDVAHCLGLGNDDVDELCALTAPHRARLTYDLFRRYLSGNYGEHLPMLRMTLEQAGAVVDVDRDLHEARWRIAERLADGTVGAELIRYYHEHNWPYPGTNRHQPLAFAEHDFHHVLGGYATTPSGELQVRAFTAGVAGRRIDYPRYLLMWEQLSAGNRNIPSPAGAFEPESCVAAFERGAQTTGDFFGTDWDPWAIISHDVEEMRTAYRIGPGAQLEPGDRYDEEPPMIRVAEG